MRFLSFHLTELTSVPSVVTNYVGSQIGANPLKVLKAFTTFTFGV
ncbi:MAG: hypothetical protein H0X49_10535 [Acidobacteria bacterium]|nr:hypothetical protein [Acidobacteriota bacterium]